MKSRKTEEMASGEGFYYKYTKESPEGEYDEIKKTTKEKVKKVDRGPRISEPKKESTVKKALSRADLEKTKEKFKMKKDKKKKSKSGKGGFWDRVKDFYREDRKSKKLLKYALTLVVIGLIFVAGLFIYLAKDLPGPGKIDSRAVAESSQIYDRTGETLLYEIHGEEKRTVIDLSEMGDYVQWATLAAEDKNYYHHMGFSLRGVLRAVFRNIQREETDNLEGGSTITQQLVKNSLLSPEQTYTRKIKELILSVEMEIKYSKDEILEMYLNEIPYGQSAYGIEAASTTFFDKQAKGLTLGEAALLAALPRAPTYYSPFGSHQDDLKIRQELILDAMVDEGYITEEEAETAKGEDLSYLQAREGIIAPHFVMYVKEKLAEKYGERLIEQGGMKIITTLDMDLQHIAEQVVPEGVDKNIGTYNANNAALVAVDPRTGQILAMQGSKDYFDTENDGNVNVAIRDRQPGSSFKPFAYAASFIKGYTPNTIIFDLRTDFGNGYKPDNYSGGFRGPVKMRDALAGSLNIPAVKTLYLAGINETLDLAHKMGFTTLNEPDRYGLSLVLGGGEVKLLDETAAFGVFANDGSKKEKTPILKIEQNGEVLEEYSDGGGDQVMDQQIARQINDVLSDANARAAVFGNALNVGSTKVAVKTGTTDEYRDAWTVGYTPNLVTGVWTGNNDNSPMTQGAAGVYVAGPIWKSFMSEALASRDPGEFIGPEPVNAGKPILDGSIAREEIVTLCKPSMKLATDRCPATMREEKKYRNVHSILYYVDKSDPRGPYPSNPAVDPQFNGWEGPVQAWADSQGYSREKPPTETDDLHNADKVPQVSITLPKSGAKVSDSFVQIEVSASAPLGMKNVNFFVEGTQIGMDNAAPYSFGYDLGAFPSGQVTLTAEAWDVVDNMNTSSVTINFENDSQINITFSPPPALMSRDEFPVSLVASTSGGSSVASVSFYYGLVGGSPILIGTDSSADAGGYVTTWGWPGNGTFNVYAVANTASGKEIYSPSSTVAISE